MGSGGPHTWRLECGRGDFFVAVHLGDDPARPEAGGGPRLTVLDPADPAPLLEASTLGPISLSLSRSRAHTHTCVHTQTRTSRRCQARRLR